MPVHDVGKRPAFLLRCQVSVGQHQTHLTVIGRPRTGFQPDADYRFRQVGRVLEQQHPGMVVTHGIVVGIAQVETDGRAIFQSQRLGFFQPGPADSVVPERHAQKLRIIGEFPVQLVPQTAVKQSLIIRVAEREAVGVTGGAGIGPAAVKDNVFRRRQFLSECAHLLQGIHVVNRELPNIIRVQVGDVFVPMVVTDDSCAPRYVFVDPL